MFDDVDLSKIPVHAAAVAGYVNGRWPTYSQLATKFPLAKHLSIAVNAEVDAECLDIERFDATPDQAPNWVRRQIARGVKLPVVYCALSDAEKVVRILAASGINRSEYRLWTAHYNYKPHLCSASCGFGFTSHADATQWTDKALGRDLDASLCSTEFFFSPPTVATRRARLRAWILRHYRLGRSWAWLKRQPQWKLWRKLGGR